MNARAGGETDITPLLMEWSQGNRGALDRVLPIVYCELRRIATLQLRKEGNGGALDPTELVHALFVQLVNQRHATWSNRAQFFATAAQMMRRILVNHARDRAAQKRGDGIELVSLSAAEQVVGAEFDLLGLHEALDALAALDARQARIVEMKFFAGLELTEIATLLGVSLATVKRDWTMARLWLSRELSA